MNDFSYAAGYLDGEGCFTLTGARRGVAAIFCETTHKPTIQWLHQLFGGNYSELLRKAKPHWRPTYRWNVNGAAAISVCELLGPFLKEKAPQAALLLQFAALPKFPGTRRGLPESVLQERENIWRQLQELKHAR